jgi:glycerate kinase
VCQAIKSGIRRYSSTIQVTTHPLADGGDGMLDILEENIGLNLVAVEVKDPLFRPVQAEYGVSPTGDTAYVEMSRASGLVLLKETERDCLETSTYGTGELILDALQRGVKRIVLGMGGSATNDAGTGVAVALGYRFLDASGAELQPIGNNLRLVETIDNRAVVPELAGVEVHLASDVQNSFYGKDGAAWTFARQKGADDEAIELLDEGLENIARLVQEKWGKNLQDIPGSGAAGGLGGGAIAFLGARLESGIEMMIATTRLEDRVADTDLVVTGEGKLDEQTLAGKVIDGVINTAEKYNKKVAVLCGASSLSPEATREFGIYYCDQILKDGRSLQDAMANGYRYLEECAFTMISAIAEECLS